MSPTIEQFRAEAAAADLVSADAWRAFWSSLPEAERPAEAAALGERLIAREMLTRYQAGELSAGRGAGLVLGDYHLLDAVGSGGMGKVFRARHRRMDRVVALKVFSPSNLEDPSALKRFEREVRAAAALVHPNIVTAYDAGEDRGTHYLVMEYVEGRSLAAVAHDDAPVAIESAVDYILQAARGLAFAHARGIVHRDIKPANLLLDRGGAVKVLDMGLARLAELSGGDDSLTAAGQLMGTLDYIAPEQAADTREADARSDVYSLGCTFYRLLTGANVYDGTTAVKKILAHCTAPIPSLLARRPDVPAALDGVFRKMVAKRPEDRYQTMEETIAALEAVSTPASLASAVVAPAPAASRGSGASLGSSGPGDSDWSSFLKSIGTSARSPQRNAEAPSRSVKTLMPPAPGDSADHATPTVANRAAEVDTDPQNESVGLSMADVDGSGRAAAVSSSAAARGRDSRAVAAAIAAAGVIVAALSYFTFFAPGGESTIGGASAGSSAAVVAASTAASPRVADSLSAALPIMAGPVDIGRVNLNTAGPGTADPGTVGPDTEAGADQANRALAFNGQQSHVVIDGFEHAGGKPLTLELWAYIGTVGHIQRPEFLIADHEFGFGIGRRASRNWEFQVPTNDMYGGNYLRSAIADDPIPVFRGVHFAGVYDGAEVRLYVDGKLRDRRPAHHPSVPVRRPLLIGAVPQEQGKPRECFFGNIDEVRVSTIVRYDRDFEPPRRHAPDNHTWALYHFDETAGDVVLDASGHDRHGRIVDARRILAASFLPSAKPPVTVINGVDVTPPMPAESPSPSGTPLAKSAGTWPPKKPAATGRPAKVAVPFSAAEARLYQGLWATYLGTRIEIEGAEGTKLVVIPPGEFSTPEACSDNWPPPPAGPTEALETTPGGNKGGLLIMARFVPDFEPPFLLATTEVTQRQFRAFAGDSGYISEKERALARDDDERDRHSWRDPIGGASDTAPVTYVTGNDAAAYCNWLSAQEGLTPAYRETKDGGWDRIAGASGYHLPFPGQWNFASHAGTLTKYYFGDDGAEGGAYAWVAQSAGGGPHAVGSLKPNAFGLFDMLGNVAEWEEPTRKPSGKFTVVAKGGSWQSLETRAAERFTDADSLGTARNHIGFRVARDPLLP